MKGIVFYYSATGNSYIVARDIAAALDGFVCANLLRAEVFDPAQYSVVGFVFPVHYIHAPVRFLDILRAFTCNCTQQVFLAATHGGSLGYALSDAREAIAGQPALVQEFRVKMPGNYLLEYGAMAYQQSRIKKAGPEARAIAEAVENRRPTKPVGPEPLARLFKHKGDAAVAGFGKLGAAFYAGDGCTGCTLCARICPVSNIRLDGAKPLWQNTCQQCMACVQRCPQNAVCHPLYRPNRRRYTHPAAAAGAVWE